MTAKSASGSFVDKVPHCAFFFQINKSQFSLIFSGSGDLYICVHCCHFRPKVGIGILR